MHWGNRSIKVTHLTTAPVKRWQNPGRDYERDGLTVVSSVDTASRSTSKPVLIAVAAVVLLLLVLWAVGIDVIYVLSGGVPWVLLLEGAVVGFLVGFLAGRRR